MTTVILAVVGLLSGLGIGFLFSAYQSRGRMERLRSDAAVLQMQYDAAEKGRQEGLQALDAARAETERVRAKAEADIAAVKAEVRQEAKRNQDELIEQVERRHKESVDQMSARFEETIAKMREEVTNVTKRLLEERQKEFDASSRESLAHIMEPLQDNIRKMNDAVKDNTLKNTQFSGQLKEGIENVLRQSQEAMKSADRLSNVLSSSNKIQGNFGEQVLTELLESSGLKKGIHYETQYVIKDEAGNALLDDDKRMKKPDVVLHLDSEHHVIIDSKVSLTAFYRYMEADNEAERKQYLKEHIDSLRKQYKNLADKDYSLHLKGAIDYVIMFVPITNALYAATQEDPRLWREAMERKVYIADEQTLFAALKIISINWRQQAQAENQQKIYQLAGEMLKRVQAFAAKFSSMGQNLKKAQEDYDDACKKLAENGQSIPQTCRKLIKLGAPYDRKKKTLLDDMIDTEELENS